MKDWYLFRLYRISKIAFLVVLAMMMGYAYCLTHSMDMMMFPYNAMFAYERKAGDSIITYRIHLNEKDIHITRFLYWKKDFFETSPRVFAHYISSGKNVYVDQYLQEKRMREPFAHWLKARLTPGSFDLAEQMAWYVRLAGEKIMPGDDLSVWAIHLSWQEGVGLVETGSQKILALKYPG